jgi:hypothetical protein
MSCGMKSGSNHKIVLTQLTSQGILLLKEVKTGESAYVTQ